MFRKITKQPKSELALGLDLGASQIKAVLIGKQGDKYALVEYAVRSLSATAAKSYKEKEFIDELQKLVDGLKTPERRAFVTISCSSAMVCQSEFPRVPLAEIKSALKINSAHYLRRDFSNYYLDAVELVKPIVDAKPIKTSKMKVLVGGASREEVDACREALNAARLKPEVIELTAISVINAFQHALPQLQEETVLLVDLGARTTTINVVQHGQPLLTRLMHFGGEQISEYLSQKLGVELPEAEAAKLKMEDSIHELIQAALLPLAREVRSSIDFFERQHDCRVHRAFACGGSSSSAPLLRFFGESSGVEFEAWNPLQTLDTSGLNGDAAGALAMGSSLAAAVGVVAARLG